MENAYTEPLAEGNYNLTLESMEVVDGKYGESYLFKGSIEEDTGNSYVLWVSKPTKFTYGTDLGKLYRATNTNVPKTKTLSDSLIADTFSGKSVSISLTYNDGANAKCKLRGA
tara:strand:+ start:266 stop:604 length:339 start_codon:yes stop_codon:yes gene_type:complete